MLLDIQSLGPFSSLKVAVIYLLFSRNLDSAELEAFVKSSKSCAPELLKFKREKEDHRAVEW